MIRAFYRHSTMTVLVNLIDMTEADKTPGSEFAEEVKKALQAKTGSPFGVIGHLDLSDYYWVVFVDDFNGGRRNRHPQIDPYDGPVNVVVVSATSEDDDPMEAIDGWLCDRITDAETIIG